jgi:hypothetical protein
VDLQEEATSDFVYDSTELIVAVRIPDIEPIAAAGGEHTMNLTI